MNKVHSFTAVILGYAQVTCEHIHYDFALLKVARNLT